ncbi:rhodanese-like domain-containing protein [Reinekea marinisedimentorum]|uniref:Phage shock protein E n=1 Tax=Reinekea marinisedimentorum TaxID=230495 RepID=A0A4R3I0N4_9GAMM|nr:rhodanese-like domain-containing protein [Reinekea marinisedimentorum]TCS38744.1 phage shock protein E [Reinekea marinisedimentorum]
MFFKRLFATIAVALSFAGAVQADEQAKAWLEQGVLIDTRTENEFNAGHIEGAELIPYDEIAMQIASIAEDKSTPILLYCRSGRRAGVAEQALQSLGYTNVRNLGGIDQAKAALAVN